MFLAMLGELLQIYNASSQSGPSELTKAFQQLEDDRQKPGKLGRERLREALGQGPERLTEGEIELVLQEAPKGSDSGNDEGDLIDYHEFVKQLKCPFWYSTIKASLTMVEVEGIVEWSEVKWKWRDFIALESHLLLQLLYSATTSITSTITNQFYHFYHILYFKMHFIVSKFHPVIEHNEQLGNDTLARAAGL